MAASFPAWLADRQQVGGATDSVIARLRSIDLPAAVSWRDVRRAVSPADLADAARLWLAFEHHRAFGDRSPGYLADDVAFELAVERYERAEAARGSPPPCV